MFKKKFSNYVFTHFFEALHLSRGPRGLINFKKIFIILSRAKNSGRQCHFKIWLDCHKLKIFPCLITPMSTKCQKNEKKITINVIQHDDRF
jgi:hypothetical protein